MSSLDCLEQEVLCGPAVVSVAVGIRAKKAFSDAAIYWTKNITFLEKMYCL